LFFFLSGILLILQKSTPQSYQHLRLLFTFNNKVIFPISFISTCLFSLIELNHYPNYVFSNYHIHYFDFIYLFFLSFLVFGLQLCLKSFPASYRWLIFLFSIALIFIFVILLTYPQDFFVKISREDGILENFQFTLYFLSAVFFS